MKKHFTRKPPIGEIVMLQGQRFELVEVEPYVRVDKTKSFVLTWESHCASCGVKIKLSTGMKIREFGKRRCIKHSSPGKPVAGNKNRKYRNKKFKK